MPPQSGHLLELLKKMKQIYKLCDEDEDGSIQVEHLVRLGSQFGLTDQEVKKKKKRATCNQTVIIPVGVFVQAR